MALVNIPLSLALAVASGATPTQGLITAFWAGLLGAIFGGSHYNIIGPTGALSGVLVSYALAYGYENLPLVALLSGILILIARLLHLDKYIIFIPKSVVHGFTLGIAGIIAFGQLDNILGLKGIPKTDSIFINTLNSLHHISETNIGIFIIFAISFGFIFLWNKKFPTFPGAIITSAAGIGAVLILNYYPSIPFDLHTLNDQYPNIEGSLFQWKFPDFSLLWSKSLWVVALATSLIAILETLLSGQIADGMTQTKFNRSKEVLGLAIANLGSGLCGGIPATAALARTALNIKSGGSHRTSGILSALCVGFITIFFFKWFTLLPMVIIASILVVVAVGMIEKKHFIHLMDNEKQAFILSLVVALITFLEDPMAGIVVGTSVALLIFVNKVAYGQTEILLWKNGKLTESLLKHKFIKKENIESDIVVYKISGTLTYINMPAHFEAINKIKDNKYVIISLRHAFYADTDGIEYLKELVECLKKNNENVILSGINEEIEKLIVKENFYKQKTIEGKIYKRTSEAINDILKRSIK